MRAEIAKLILRDIEFPEHTIATITRVEASPNLNHANVFISVIPDDKAKAALDILEKNIYHIQKALDRLMRMRPVPQIRFIIDLLPQEAQKIDILLEKVKKKK